MRNPTHLMRGFVSLPHRRPTNFTPNQRKNRPNRTARALIRAAVCLTLIAQGLFIETTRRAAGQSGEEFIPSVAVSPASVAVVNFAQQSAAEENGGGTPSAPTAIPESEGPPEPESPNTGAPAGGISMGEVDGEFSGEQDEPVSPGPPAQLSTEITPPALNNFQAQPDGGVIPPDTHGGVGLDKVMSTLNTNYQVQHKATGLVLSSVTIGGFWAPTGANNPYDPKTLYDPYNNRWILTAVSDRGTASSSILVAVSQTPDPNGLYHLARLDRKSVV